MLCSSNVLCKVQGSEIVPTFQLSAATWTLMWLIRKTWDLYIKPSFWSSGEEEGGLRDNFIQMFYASCDRLFTNFSRHQDSLGSDQGLIQGKTSSTAGMGKSLILLGREKLEFSLNGKTNYPSWTWRPAILLDLNKQRFYEHRKTSDPTGIGKPMILLYKDRKVWFLWDIDYYTVSLKRCFI